MSAIAIVPARGGSKRILRKNVQEVGGKPMVCHVVERLRECESVFDEIFVSTEDAEIARIGASCGAKIHDRPAALASDSAAELDAVLHLLDERVTQGMRDPERFCVVYPTAILLETVDIIQSGNVLDSSGADVVMGVSRYDIHPYKALVTDDRGFLQPLFPRECQMRTQDYPSVCASNGTLYWLRTEPFRKNRDYYSERLTPYFVPPERAVDVDTPEDLERVKTLFRNKRENVER